MNRMRFAVTLLFLGGCALFGGEVEERIVRVDRVEVGAHTERAVRFEVTGRWRNTCGEVSRFEADRDGSVYRVRMYGEQPEGAICGQAVTPISGTWETEVPKAGTYTFRFWQTEDATLDTTLTFE